MLIGIDGNESNQEKRVGIGRYGLELMNQFQRFINLDLRFTIYLKDVPGRHMPKERDGWEYKVMGPGKLWTQLGLPFNLFLDKNKPDVFWTPTHYAPRFCPCPSVVSIMDLSYLRYPEMFKKRDLYQLRSWSKYSINRAVRILTISKASRADIIEFYRADPEKVVVVYPGINPEINMNSNVSNNQVLTKYKIRSNFILYVGTLQPRKNLVRLIEAFCLLEDKRLQLVIIGKKGWMYDEIFDRVKELELEDRVVFTGFVPEEELPTFYKEAKFIILVSLYEGFGLPPLEAMSYGTPAIVSNVSSLPEIVGKAGILINPEDTANIAAGITKALSMSKTDYDNLGQLAKEQAKKFNWERTAEETLKVLQEVALGK